MLRPINPIQVSNKPHLRAPIQDGLTFKPGEIFQGIVLRKYPGGDVLVSSRGTQFLAHTALNLLEGQKHRFQVKTLGRKIELKVLGGGIRKFQSPMHIWASTREARGKISETLMKLSAGGHLKGLNPESLSAFRRVSQLLPAVIYTGPGDEKLQWISRHLQGIGVFWENKVARYLLGKKDRPLKHLLTTDLKGVLLSLEKALGAQKKGGTELESLLLQAREAIHLIEQDQFLNLSSLEEELGWFWFIPGKGEEGFRKAEVFAEKGKEGEGLYFSMLLEFTRLGEMEVEVSLVGSVVGVNILLQDEERVDFITNQLPLLEAGLKKEGMTVGQLICDVKANQTIEMPPFSGIKGAPPSIHLVI